MQPPEGMPKDVASLLAECWNHDPEKRPNAEKLKEKLEDLNQKYEAGEPSLLQGC